jgi:hypothetical protein
MISKPLESVTEGDLKDLVSAAVAERKTLDYKQQLPGGSDADKRELLADVSSFANTAGGDLLFGMTENAGVPTGVRGVQIGDPEQEVLRLESIIRTGLSPRIRQSTQPMRLASGLHVLIIRIERSWYGPHRVVFKGDSRFYGRSTNGKYELDVTDLRNAFLFANAVTEKIAAFRSERVIALENGAAPMPMADGPKVVLHCIPLESFGAMPQYDVLSLRQVKPMKAEFIMSGWSDRINFDGKIVLTTDDPPSSYTQIFRNGVIEAVLGGLLLSRKDSGILPSRSYEEAFLKYLPYCFEILKGLGCSPPVLVAMSLTNVRGWAVAIEELPVVAFGNARRIDRDVLMLPEILVEDLTAPVAPVLKPMFDLIWNACGIARSPDFDDGGNWRPRR